MKTPILGGQYIARSLDAADNRLVNLFPEAVAEGGKELGFLQRCPGLTQLTTVGVGPIRGIHKCKEFLYVVSGAGLYSVSSSYLVTYLGSVVGTASVSMANNGIQLFIVAAPKGYIYNTNTAVFAQILDPDFLGASSVAYIDGYFTYTEPDSQKVWVTSLLDGSAIDPLEFASAEGAPDNLLSVEVDHREIWLFGTDSIEVWYNSGDLDFPLTRIQGAFFELGCLSADSIAKLDNALFWLGSDNRGYGIVYRTNGYAGIRVSDHSVETIIQGFAVVSDAIAYTYQQSGHAFYVLSFPTEGRTFAYDMATGNWHERAGFESGAFVAHKGEFQINFNNTSVVAGRYSNALYKLDFDSHYEGSAIQKWVRSWRALPAGSNNLKRTIHHQLEVDLESGVGLNVGQGSEAMVMLRWSDDGGHTWSNEHWRTVGKIGKTLQRTIWRRLGKSRDRVYELSGTDPISITILGAELQLTELGS